MTYAAAKFADLLGVTLSAIKVDREANTILFEAIDGRAWLMEHEQDCCESVEIDDICGDLADLIGEPILLAEEANSEDSPELDLPSSPGYCSDSHTWTFYKLATNRGFATVRWHGGSNGYYSERVDFVKVIN